MAEHAWYRVFSMDGSNRIVGSPSAPKEDWSAGFFIEAWPVKCGNCGISAYQRCWYEADGYYGWRDNGDLVMPADGEEGPHAVMDKVTTRCDFVISEAVQTPPPACP